MKRVPICSRRMPWRGPAMEAVHPTVQSLGVNLGPLHVYPTGQTNRYERVQCLWCASVMTFPVNER